MLLTDNFIIQRSNYSELKNYSIRKEKVTNIYYRVFLESKSVSIRLDIEENESYVSFLVSHITPNRTLVYYGLSDYATFEGEKRSIFQSDTEEQIFKQGIIKHIKNYKKMFSSDKNGDGIVTYIYTFLNEFVKNLCNERKD